MSGASSAINLEPETLASNKISRTVSDPRGRDSYDSWTSKVQVHPSGGRRNAAAAARGGENRKETKTEFGAVESHFHP